ncbi:DNA polymerase IV [Mucilaginibacter achroorhodeus]|uniref:DNA polymerase IV n=1 Tax=Mucilaginibacter achroorhodeus TaxID=2599294 RepID=A0A563U5X8_9SPHI|nr:DNA polymerase IV [Mucilaginibacter achroorhodeus]TWR26766.1 DNA polymerase IV [Mucilaginibacter achroorhodeus]
MRTDRQIIHMDQDAFFVSVEVRKNPELRGKPVIIGSLSDRGVVTSCSYEARKFGIHAAMPARMARMLCPHGVWVRGNMDEYSKASHEITEILKENVPLIEKASIDEHFIDMTGMDKHFGTLKYARELRVRVMKETALPISFGLSVNKTVSKMATNECKPNGELNIEKPVVQPFLNPLSIRKIPGLGEKSFIKLSDMGIRRIYELAQVHPEYMNSILGKNGIGLLQKAKGIDDSPIIPYHEQKSIGTQSTFKNDSIDLTSINHLLTAMVMDLAFELRQQHKQTACITVTIRYSTREDVTKQASIPYTALDAPLITKAKELFRQAYQKRLLIRLVGIRLSNLVNGFEQIDLYAGSEQQYSLCQAMDRIRRRFGPDAIKPASVINLDI